MHCCQPKDTLIFIQAEVHDPVTGCQHIFIGLYLKQLTVFLNKQSSLRTYIKYISICQQSIDGTVDLLGNDSLQFTTGAIKTYTGSGTDLVIGMEGAALYASSPNALEVLLGEALAKTWANRYNKNTDIVL